jgi:hypothetical protein
VAFEAFVIGSGNAKKSTNSYNYPILPGPGSQGLPALMTVKKKTKK